MMQNALHDYCLRLKVIPAAANSHTLFILTVVCPYCSAVGKHSSCLHSTTAWNVPTLTHDALLIRNSDFTPFSGSRNPCRHLKLSVEVPTLFKNQKQGCLPGSVGTVCDSQSQDHEFKAHVRCRGYLIFKKKKQTKTICYPRRSYIYLNKVYLNERFNSLSVRLNKKNKELVYSSVPPPPGGKKKDYFV